MNVGASRAEEEEKSKLVASDSKPSELVENLNELHFLNGINIDNLLNKLVENQIARNDVDEELSNEQQEDDANEGRDKRYRYDKRFGSFYSHNLRD